MLPIKNDRNVTLGTFRLSPESDEICVKHPAEVEQVLPWSGLLALIEPH